MQRGATAWKAATALESPSAAYRDREVYGGENHIPTVDPPLSPACVCSLSCSAHQASKT